MVEWEIFYPKPARFDRHFMEISMTTEIVAPEDRMYRHNKLYYDVSRGILQ